MIPRRHNLTKFFGIIAIIAVTLGSGILLTACGKKPMDKIEVVSGTMPSMTANMNTVWDNLKIKITRTNKKAEEIRYADNKDAFTVPTRPDIAGEQEVRISYTEKNTTKSVDVTVTVGQKMEIASTDRIQGFAAPEFVNLHYSQDLAQYQLLDETDGDTAAEKINAGPFEVGDDNLFLIAPEIRIAGYYAIWDGSFQIDGDNIFDYTLQESTDGITFTAVADPMTYLDAVDGDRVGFDFKDGVATDKIFKLTIKPSAAITTQLVTGVADTAQYDFTFVVRDGWNAYDLRDLQLLSNRGYYRYSMDGDLVGLVKKDTEHPNATWDGLGDKTNIQVFKGHAAALNDWTETESATDYFWGTTYRGANVDTYLKSMTSITKSTDWDTTTGNKVKDDYDTFAKFLAATIKGMYLQRDITILQEHRGDDRNTLPREFFADGETKLARAVAIFDHVTQTDEEFTFNGNYFSVDASDIAIEKSANSSGAGINWGESAASFIFSFGETQVGTGAESEQFYNPEGVVFKNLAIKGNAKRLMDKETTVDGRNAVALMSIQAIVAAGFGNNGIEISRILFDEVNFVLRVDKNSRTTFIPDAKVTVRDCKVTNIFSGAIAGAGYSDIYVFHSEFENVDAPTMLFNQRRGIPVLPAGDTADVGEEYYLMWPSYRMMKEWNDNKDAALADNGEEGEGNARADMLEPSAFVSESYIDLYTMEHCTKDFDVTTSTWVQGMEGMLSGVLGEATLGSMFPPAGLIPGWTVMTANDPDTDVDESGRYALPFLMVNVGNIPHYNIKNSSQVYVVDNETDKNVLLHMNGDAEITQFFDAYTTNNNAIDGNDEDEDKNKTEYIDSQYYVIVGQNGTLLAWTDTTGKADRSDATSPYWRKGKMMSALANEQHTTTQTQLEFWDTDDWAGVPAEVIAAISKQDLNVVNAARETVIEGIKSTVTSQTGGVFITLDLYKAVLGGSEEQFWEDMRNEVTFGEGANAKKQSYMFVLMKMGDNIFDICIELKQIA